MRRMPATSCATRRSPSPALIGEGEAPKIRIIPNKTADTLTVADSGIGMDRQELIDNLGTIARSGTKAFVARLERGQGRRRPDRPVRRRLLFRLHGGRSHRRHQPPGRQRRGLDLDVVRRRRIRGRAGQRGGRQAGHARHRDRAAPEERCGQISRAARDRARRHRLFRQHPVSDRTRPGGRGAAADQFGQRAVAALEIRTDQPKTTPRPTSRSRTPSTSRR